MGEVRRNVNPATGRPGPAPKPAVDGDKIQARHRVNKEVRCGALSRPDSLRCHDCGGPAAEYDHYLGYAAANHLDVQAVCSKCHSARDCPKANATHCARGHEFTVANTYIKPNGCRLCRTCATDRERSRPPRGSEYWRKVNEKRRK